MTDESRELRSGRTASKDASHDGDLLSLGDSPTKGNLKVTILVPTRNEQRHIAAVLENILSQDFPLDDMQVLVIDGRSTDGTRRIVEEYEQEHEAIRLLDNPHRVVPHALNKGLGEAVGDIIVRMDAHSEYPLNYVSRLVACLIEHDADNVGGVWDTVPATDSYTARSVAAAMASPFGIGNATYRLGATNVQLVDTVPFGCYRKDVFNRIGFFDEELIRNQDDEFNARLVKHGGKILLIPDVVIKYHARDTLKKMCRMFYQYGLFKPLVLKKVGSPATLRQLVPLFFVVANLCLGTLAVAVDGAGWAWLGMNLLYLCMALLFSWKKAVELKDLKLFFGLPLVFFLIHCSYGLGYLAGIGRFLLLRRIPNSEKTTINR